MTIRTSLLVNWSTVLLSISILVPRSFLLNYFVTEALCCIIIHSFLDKHINLPVFIIIYYLFSVFITLNLIIMLQDSRCYSHRAIPPDPSYILPPVQPPAIILVSPVRHHLFSMSGPLNLLFIRPKNYIFQLGLRIYWNIGLIYFLLV